MSWFNKKQAIVHPVPTDKAIFEIEAHKDAKAEAVREAKDASEKLNKLLVDNGFTLKIYLATGGQKYKGRH